MRLLARFVSPVEADVACSRLRAAGIDARVFDNFAAGFTSMLPGDPQGLRVMVPEQQYDEAAALLGDIAASNPRPALKRTFAQDAPIILVVGLMLVALAMAVVRAVLAQSDWLS